MPWAPAPPIALGADSLAIVSKARSGSKERLEPARAGRRRFLLGGAGVAGAAVVGRASMGSAAASLLDTGVPRAQVEASNSVGPVTGGPPLALGVRRVIWSVDVDQPAFALTFDDGPDPEFTPQILDILAERKLTATFNMMGWNADQHPDLARAVVAAGHELANHTWTHLDLAYEAPDSTYDEMRKGKDVITAVTGQVPRFFRPPRGELTGCALRTAALLDHDVLLYTMFGDIAGVETPERVARYVDETLAAGHVIVFHDGIGRGTFNRSSSSARDLAARRHAEIEALPRILDAAMAKGLRPMSASQLLTHERA